MPEANQTWDLDVIFTGASESKAYVAFVDELERDTALFASTAEGVASQSGNGLADLLVQAQALRERRQEAAAFSSCLNAQNVNDEKAKAVAGRLAQMSAIFQTGMMWVQRSLAMLDDADFSALKTQDALKQMAFFLEETRRQAKDRLEPAQERLILSLGVDGYHAWGNLYNTVTGSMRVRDDNAEASRDLSMGQLQNALDTPNRARRMELFAKWENAWSAQEEVIADALNHLAGFRLQAYKARGWTSVLKEPLENNRMSEATLSAMWQAVADHAAVASSYLKRKAELFGIDRLAWHDVSAPVGTSSSVIPYETAQALIIQQFGRFSPDLAAFATRAFADRWIESEDRAGKRAGGFCTSFPLTGQSRIFMTYSGTTGNVSTLAHELGHAYHHHVMRDIPGFSRQYPMSVAETASTFAEQIVSDAAVAHATDRDEKIALLGEQADRAIAFLMDIRSRFLFETAFYEERKKGLLNAKALSELMTAAQKEAFAGMLSEYHPHFWASKLHFYSTGAPFYNFPYTFGYLFSAGVYAEAKVQGPSFAKRYVSLLRDTGRMTVEQLAQTHLGADTTKVDFWTRAADEACGSIRAFLALTEK
ncbi:MAG: M3 family oligoendopeptidase [Firmicutes bacterium]|nr:M3 family oligoendopeptidase [Bacillota bacterium]